jgi:rod shape-determining protein MreD
MKAILAIAFTLSLAVLFDVLPAPSWFNWVRPEFTLLVLIYWVIAMPERCGVLVAVLLGLMQDSLAASFLGIHVISFTVVTGITLLAYKRLRVFDAWQQASFVFMLVGMANLLHYWLSMLTGNPHMGWWFLLPSFISALIWPWLMVVLRKFRRQVGLVKRLI